MLNRSQPPLGRRLPLLLTLLCLLTPGAIAETPPRLLVMMGGGTWESSVFSMLRAIPDVQMTLVESAEEAFALELAADFDVILMYNLDAAIDEPDRQLLRDYLAQGKGLVVLHHALALSRARTLPPQTKRPYAGRRLRSPPKH